MDVNNNISDPILKEYIDKVIKNDKVVKITFDYANVFTIYFKMLEPLAINTLLETEVIISSIEQYLKD
jgi:hypothetical protein